MIHEFRRWLPFRPWLMAMVFGLGANALRAQDPVESLREHLRRSLPSIGEELAPDVLRFRKAKIQELADRMQSADKLRDALVLDEWKVDSTSNANINDGVGKIDVEMRRMIGERLKKTLENMARHKDSTARIAVANMIAEPPMGPAVRALDRDDTGGYCRSLVPLVAQLCRDPDIGVRQQALRTMGTINGPPKEVTGVFRQALEGDKDVGARRLAADGLQQMMKISSHILRGQLLTLGISTTPKDVLDVLQAIAPVAAIGVRDSDSQVRMLSLQAVQAAAQALGEILQAPGFRDGDAGDLGGGKNSSEIWSRKLFPPPDRRLTPTEKARILDAYQRTETDLAKYKPMLDTLRKEIIAYTQGLRDPEPLVRLAACEAFESLANARLRLVRRINALPAIKNDAGIDRAPADLIKEADFLQPALDKEMPQVTALLRDHDVRVRRSAATALETLEEKAAPAMAGLITALLDPDRIVRWTAAKALGSMPFDQAGPAIVPLAKLLNDPELPIHIVAANSLEALGSVASPAVPLLAQSLKSGDVEARLAAMSALLKIGAAHLQPAIPALIGCLNDRDPRIVRAASGVLADIGPPAVRALPELRRLIGHDDADVRQGASGAILSILRTPE